MTMKTFLLILSLLQLPHKTMSSFERNWQIAMSCSENCIKMANTKLVPMFETIESFMGELVVNKDHTVNKVGISFDLLDVDFPKDQQNVFEVDSL
jgi:hypothetical protein